MDQPISRSSRVLIAVALAAGTLLATALLAGIPPAGPSLAEAQYEPPPARVTLCHHAARAGRVVHVTITVNQSAVASHLRHGDTRGSCGTALNRARHRAAAHVRAWHVSQVTICHHAKRGNSVAHVTLRVRQSQLRTHILHGDSVGVCSSARGKRVHGTAAHKRRWHRP